MVLAISTSGCETCKQAKTDFKTLVNDVSINIGHPYATQWRKGTSTNK